MAHIRWHKDADPNDPRYVALAGPLPSLNEDPELEVELKLVVETTVDNVTTFLGRDPNDVRLHVN